jgi:hypothetical protein
MAEKYFTYIIYNKDNYFLNKNRNEKNN